MLTPDEIATRQFLVQLRGYDRDEVTAFLARVGEEFGELRARLDGLTAELESVRRAGTGAGPASVAPTAADPSALFAEIGQQTARILEAANEAGGELKRRAREQAESELTTAQSRAAELLAEGQRRRAGVEDQLSSLAASRDRVAEELRGVGRTVADALHAIGMEAAGSVGAGADDGPSASVLDTPVAEGPPGAAALDALEIEQAPAQAAALDALRPPLAGERTGWHEQAASGSASSSEPVVQRLRAEALAPLHPKFVRRLVRGLGELQERSLDRLARQGGSEDVLPSAGELRSFAELASEYLDTAFASGTDAAEAVAGTSLPSPEEMPPLAEDFATSLGVRVVDRLRQVLGGGGDPEKVASEVAGAFEELKDGAADPVAADALIAAYEAGFSAALRAGGLDRGALLAGSA